MLDKLQKQVWRTVGPSLAASLKPLVHCQNLISLIIFYRNYFGRCSSDLGQQVPIPYSRGRSTCYSDILLGYSVTIPRFYKDIYAKFFSSNNWTLEFFAHRMFSFDLWSIALNLELIFNLCVLSWQHSHMLYIFFLFFYLQLLTTVQPVMEWIPIKNEENKNFAQKSRSIYFLSPIT